MVIVDDRLSLLALSGRPVPGAATDDVVATTWAFHYRLLRAVADDRVVGSLSRSAPSEVRARAADPPSNRLVVLDPRGSTALAAELAARHGLNMLASDLFAAAKAHAARVVLSAANVGRRWPEIMAAEEIELRIAS